MTDTLDTPSISIESSPTLSPAFSPRKLRFDDRSQTKISRSLKNHAHTSSNSSLSLNNNNVSESSFLNWNELTKISNHIKLPQFVSKYGSPLIIECSAVYICIGTSKGWIIGFNYRQEIEFYLNNEDQNDVSAISFSSDSAYLASGFNDGKILLWDLSDDKPFYTIYPITLDNRLVNQAQGHLINVPITNINFIGDLHNKLITCDKSGLVFYHNGFRKFMKNYFSSEKVLGKNDKNDMKNYMVHDCQTLPLGTSHQLSDHIGLMAVITNNILVIVSVLSLNNPDNNNLLTHFKIAKSKNVNSNTPIGCLSWYPCMNKKNGLENAKLAYSWNNVLTVLEIENNKLPSNLMEIIENMKDKDRGVSQLPITKTCRWSCPSKFDTIISIKWLSFDKILLVVKNNQNHFNFISLYYCTNNNHNNVSISSVHIDESPFHFTNSPNSIKSFKDRLIVMNNVDNKIHIGRCITWADRLLRYLSKGDYSTALMAANDYYNSTDTGRLVVDGLPDNQEERCKVVKPYLLKIMNESINYLFEENQDYYLDVYINIISYLDEDLSELLELIFERVDAKLFFEILEPYILTNGITYLPPIVLKKLVELYTENNKGETLTEIICILDTKTLDIDLTLNLCEQYHLIDCWIYIWNYLLKDYKTPLIKLLDDLGHDDLTIYSYISYILTGRQYPIDRFIQAEEEELARKSICEILFNINPIENKEIESIFPYLYKLLRTNSFETLSAINEFFENPCLNDDKLINRQYIIDALIDIYDSNNDFFNEGDNIQLSIFLARNYPKYQQFIRLSESILDKIIDDLCSNSLTDLQYDCELALQSLLPLYEPVDDTLLLEKLKGANFYDVLINIYKNENKYDLVLKMWLQRQNQQLGDNYHIDTMTDIFENAINLKDVNRMNFVNVIKENFKNFLDIDLRNFESNIDKFDQNLHKEILNIDNEQYVLQYLALYFTHPQSDIDMISRYIELLSSTNSQNLFQVVDLYVSKLASDEAKFNSVKEALQKNQQIDSLTRLYIHQNQFHEALDESIRMMGNYLQQEFKFEQFDKIFQSALEICENPKTYHEKVGEISLNEQMWLELIENLVLMANDKPKHISDYINQCIHDTFRRVIDTKLDSGKEHSFLVIFNRFLEHSSSNTKVATLSNVRSILNEVFVSYSYESEILSISLSMLNQGIYESMKEIKLDKLKGWDIKNKNCTSCGKEMWGSKDLSLNLKAWESSQHLMIAKKKLDDSKFSHHQLIFFKCSHGYHYQCLRNLGLNHCVICIQN